MAEQEHVRCPLCGSLDVGAFGRVHERDYFACAVCRLTFMAPADRPRTDAERARYESHRNHPDDPGYRQFLNRLCEPLAALLPSGAEGLDYGSGPGPTLAPMFRELGHVMTNYDPFFARDDAALARSYDFITCSETAEHFFSPDTEFQRLDRLLRPGGWLGIMTEVRQDDRPFASWWYVRDPTHVCFYHPATMLWIATRFSWLLQQPRRNVVLFRKSATDPQHPPHLAEAEERAAR